MSGYTIVTEDQIESMCQACFMDRQDGPDSPSPISYLADGTPVQDFEGEHPSEPYVDMARGNCHGDSSMIYRDMRDVVAN